MPSIISIVGRSNSGKTTLLEGLIGEFKRRGYRVASAKHEAHGFEIDQPGKDSWRLAQAGSEVVVLASPEKLALIRQLKREPTVEELSYIVGEDVDLLLVEGYKSGKASKIEVHRKGRGELLCPPQELVAVVTDEPMDLPIPQYSPEDIKGVADLLERNFFSAHREEVMMWVNGTSIPLNPFVQVLLSKTLLGMVSALKGVEEVKSLQIWLRRT